MGLIKDLKRYDNLLALLDDDSIPAEEAETAIQEAGSNLPTMVDDFAAFLRELDGEVETLRREEDRLKKRREARENLKKRLREAAAYWMEKSGKRRLTGVLNTVSLRKSERVVFDDEAAVPSKFKEIVYKTHKTPIKEALKAGEKVPGAHLETAETLFVR